MHRLEQHAVGVAVHDAAHGAVRRVADRVGKLAGAADQLGRVRHELPADRIVRIGNIDQFGHDRRDRHRVARRHLLEGVHPGGIGQSGCDQIGNRAQRLAGLAAAGVTKDGFASRRMGHSWPRLVGPGSPQAPSGPPGRMPST